MIEHVQDNTHWRLPAHGVSHAGTCEAPRQTCYPNPIPQADTRHSGFCTRLHHTLAAKVGNHCAVLADMLQIESIQALLIVQQVAEVPAGLSRA